jgi:cyclopropane fatty-acyl-phospholipid synthase-like methyltransferase
MITCDHVTKKDIRVHYDLATLFYWLLWGRHIHHGLWEGAETASQAQVQLIERLAAAANIQRWSSVLDVGCGMGGSSIHLARHLQCQVVGLTLSPVQRLWARVASWLGGVGEYNRFLCKDAEKVWFEPGSFDVVWSVECTEHLFDKARFLQHVAGWLKPGGRVAICAWLAGEHLDMPADREQVHRVCSDFLCPSLGSADDYQSWMRQAGLEVLSCDDITEKVTRTWEICLERTRRPGIRGFARLAGAAMDRFVQAFEGILHAYRSGAMRYGCIVAKAPA